MRFVDFQTWEVDRYHRLMSDLPIDTMRLTDELTQIASNVQEACEYSAKAIGIRDEAELYSKTTKSQTNQRLRSIGLENGKPWAEARLNAEVPGDQDVIDAEQYAIEAAVFAGRWQALVRGYHAKQESLKSITQLTIAGYLSPTTFYEDRRAELARNRENKTETVKVEN